MITKFPLVPRLLCGALALQLLAGCSGKKGSGVAGFEASAQKYFDAGEYEKAKADTVAVLKMEPANASAVRRMGLIWVQQGAFHQALPFLNEAVKSSPADIALRAQFMEILQNLNYIGNAREQAEAILKIEPGHGDALRTLVDTAIQPDEVRAAREKLKAFPNQQAVGCLLATAGLHLRDKDKDAATPVINRALEADPKSVKALLMGASLLLMEKDEAGFEAKLKAASEASPLRSLNRLLYADALVRKGDPGARQQIDHIIRQAPDFLPALILSAQLTVNEKKPEEALKTLEGVLAVDQRNPSALLLQAKIWIGQKQAPKAVPSLESLVRDEPNNLAAKIELARALGQSGDLVKSAEIAKEVLLKAPGLPDALLIVALSDLRSGRAADVISPMRSLLEQRPAHLYASHLLADALEATGEAEEAVKVLGALLAANPKDPRPRFRSAEILRGAGKLREARTTYDALLKEFPDHFAVIFKLVELDLSEKNPDAAAARIEPLFIKFSASEDRIRSAGVWFLKGTVENHRKEWDKAEASVLKAIELDPALGEAHQLLVAVYLASGRIPEGIARLEAMIARNPKATSTMKALAGLYTEQKDYPKAAGMYEKAIAATPQADPLVLNNYAILLSEHLDQRDKALEMAAKARSRLILTEGDADGQQKVLLAAVSDTMGWILYRQSKFREAMERLQEAVRGLPDNLEVHYHLGKTACMTGDLPLALTSLKKVAEGNALETEKAEANAALALLESAATRSAAEWEEEAKKSPGDILVLMRLAQAREAAGDHGGAAKTWEQALTVSADFYPASLQLARLYAGPLTDLTKALKHGERARELQPENPAAAGLLGSIHYKSGNVAGAFRILETAMHAGTLAPEVQLDFGRVAYLSGKFALSRETMQALVTASGAALEAAEAKLFLTLTAPVNDPAALAAAVPAAEEALQKDPGYVPALLVRAASLAGVGKKAEAVAICEEVLKSYPDCAAAQKQLAELWMDDPKGHDKGYPLALKARDAFPGDAGLIRALAIFSYRKENFRLSISLFQELANVKPLDASALYYTGMARFRSNDKPGALEDLTKAVEGRLPEPLAGAARGAIDEINKGALPK